MSTYSIVIPGTYSLTLRQVKGSELTIPEMDDNLLYLTQLGLSKGLTGPQGVQGPWGFDGADGEVGPQGAQGVQGVQGAQGATGINGDLYFGTFSGLYTVPNVGYPLELSIPTGLAYTSGQYIIMYNVEDSFWAEDDYDDDSTLASKIEGEIEWYDTTTGTMSLVTTWSQQVGSTASFRYINLTGARGEADKYFATSNTYMAVPSAENVVEIVTQKNLAYSIGQWVIVTNNLSGFYVDNDYDDDDSSSGLFYGQIDSYDQTSGTMSIITESSYGIGQTFSFWYLNLSGNMGPQGASAVGNVGGVTGAAGNQGYIQYNSSGSFSGSSLLTFDGTDIQLGGGIGMVSDQEIKFNGSSDPYWHFSRISNYNIGGLTGSAMRVYIPNTAEGFSVENTSFPVFQVSGNGSYCYIKSDLFDNNDTSSISINNRLLNDENGTHAILWDTSNSTLRYGGQTKFDWKRLAMPTLGGSGSGFMNIDNSGNLSWTTEKKIYQRIVPSDGDTYSIPDYNSVYMNLNANGTLNDFTVKMPPNPIDGQIVNIIISNDNIFNWNINTLNILANTTSFYQSMDNSAPTQSIWPHRSSSFMWVSIDSIWARLT